ncbi:MAG: lysophospholipid acyltransferase family protein [Desulfobacteraceae bacterium]|nr:lysophospholipid acyltransferase family protein [Desulfobacteraceae bacterium]
MKLTDNIIYFGISTFMSLLGMIPISIGNMMGDIIGSTWFFLDKKHRTLTISNIQHAYENEKNEKEIKLIAKKVFKNSARMLFEHTKFHRMKREDLHKMFSITGLDNLKAAHEEGKGILGFTGHLGNWELLSALAYITKIDFAVVYKTIEFAPLNRYIIKKREFTGAKMFPVHNALDAIVKSLKQGSLAGIWLDQNVRKRERGVFINFFNQKACTTKGLARLALSTKAPVIPVFTFKDKGKTHIVILPKMPLIKTKDMEKDILDNTQAYHSVIEKYVRKYPEQWFWIHNRWKTRPLRELDEQNN